MNARFRALDTPDEADAHWLHERHAPPAPRNAATLFDAVPTKHCTWFAAGEWLVSSELGERDDRLLLARFRPVEVTTI